MAGTKGEERIVEGHEEIGGRKIVNNEKDTRLAKRAKAEGNEAADCRNLAGDGTQEGVELNNRLERLRGLLEDNPKRLRNKDVEDLIRHLDVNDIISLGLKSDREKENTDHWHLEEVGHYVPSLKKVHHLMRLMLQSGIEELRAVDLFILYNNLPKSAFAFMLSHTLDSYKKRHLDGGSVSLCTKEKRVLICTLCRVLPWKLFAHVMYDMTMMPVFKYSTTSSSEEEEELDEEGTLSQKKAAESCEICYGKGKHSGVYGYYCSFWDSLPCGVTVGPSHVPVCEGCGRFSTGSNTFECCSCGSEIGLAIPRSLSWISF